MLSQILVTFSIQCLVFSTEKLRWTFFFLDSWNAFLIHLLISIIQVLQSDILKLVYWWTLSLVAWGLTITHFQLPIVTGKYVLQIVKMLFCCSLLIFLGAWKTILKNSERGLIEDWIIFCCFDIHNYYLTFLNQVIDFSPYSWR